MASEIRVNKIENRSGLGTVTFADTGVDLAGIVTATTFSGSGASLTSLPAANITGTLPAISAANLTNVPAANITGTLPAIDGSNLTGIGGTDFIHAEQISVSGVTTSQAFIPSQGQLSHRNLIINGDMSVAQRGTSSTSTGYTTVDRITTYIDNIGVTPTYSQVDVTSGGAYNAGFRKAFQVTKGAGTANAASQIQVTYKVEARDIAKSGWNYTDPNSFITLSFWVKSSVSFNMKGYFYHHDSVNSGITQSYPLETGTLTADTWTKIVRKIPGNSNVAFDMDNDVGLTISFGVYGTNYSSSNPPVNQWITYNASTLTNPSETTWYTTNDATLEFTGLQLEVGEAATSFEHHRHADELRRCQRYYEIVTGAIRAFDYGNYVGVSAPFKVTKRTIPTNTFVDNGLMSGMSFQTFITSSVTTEAQLEGCFPQFNAGSGGYSYGFKITSECEL